MKELSKTLVIKEFLNSFSLAKKSAMMFLAASIIDAIFFLAWGFFTTPVRDKIVEHSVLIANNLSPLISENGRIKTGILGYLIGPELRPMTGKLILLILILFVVIYIVYNIFHGTSWWITTRIAGQKWDFKQYMLKFAKINLIWIFCYIIYKLMDVIFGLRHVIIEKLAPGTPNVAGSLLLIVIGLIGIAAFLSYPVLRANAIFKTSLRMSAPLIILSASLFLAVQYILNLISKINIDVALVVGIILLFPTMNIVRIYATRVMKNVHTRN